MEVLVNTQLVSRRAKIGKYASLIGLAILAGGLVASFNPQYVYLSFGALIAGFLLSQIGNYNLVRWGRRPRADEVLAKALKGLDRKFRLYNYYLPAAHVLLGPTGLFVFLVKPHSGQIYCAGRRWRRKMGLGQILVFFGQEALGNPTVELELEIKQLAKWIAERQPDLHPTIRGAVVFSHPRVELHLEEPAVPVLQPNQLKLFIRRPANENGYLSAEERRALAALFDQTIK